MPNSRPTFRSPPRAIKLGNGIDASGILLRELLPLAGGAYVDDVFGREGNYLGSGIVRTPEILFALLGGATTDHKGQPPLARMRLLGAAVSPMRNASRARSKDGIYEITLSYCEALLLN